MITNCDKRTGAQRLVRPVAGFLNAKCVDALGCESGIAREQRIDDIVGKLFLLVPLSANAPATETAPPRTVADIVKVLDLYKPDPALATKAREAAQAEPLQCTDRRTLMINLPLNSLRSLSPEGA